MKHVIVGLRRMGHLNLPRHLSLPPPPCSTRSGQVGTGNGGAAGRAPIARPWPFAVPQLGAAFPLSFFLFFARACGPRFRREMKKIASHRLCSRPIQFASFLLHHSPLFSPPSFLPVSLYLSLPASLEKVSRGGGGGVVGGGVLQFRSATPRDGVNRDLSNGCRTISTCVGVACCWSSTMGEAWISMVI